MGIEDSMSKTCADYITATTEWRDVCALLNTLAMANEEQHGNIRASSMLACALLAEIKSMPDDKQSAAIAEFIHNLQQNIHDKVLKKAYMLCMKPKPTEH